MDTFISGIQQIGVGIPDLKEAWDFYTRYFSLNIPIFQDIAEAPYMTAYTGGKVQKRNATLAINIQGGGGFEIWQYISRKPQPPSFSVQLGDFGIFVVKIKSRNVRNTFEAYKDANLELFSGIGTDPLGRDNYFVKDPWGNFFQIIPGKDWFSSKGRAATGGVGGCIVGVSDIEESRKVYSEILGYDTLLYDEEGKFSDLSCLPGGEHRVRRVLLTHSKPRMGVFSRLLGSTEIELVQSLERKPVKIFRDRYWGDIGFIHICFDVRGMEALEKKCREVGFPFTVNSKDSFDMGEASGQFTYIEDPDGTLIEFVETHKLPILKKLGWYLDLRKRKPGKPLPDWLLKTLRFNRKRV